MVTNNQFLWGVFVICAVIMRTVDPNIVNQVLAALCILFFVLSSYDFSRSDDEEDSAE